MILQRGSVKGPLKIHLINPSDSAFGTAVITPRWLYVLATATPIEFGDPEICDETLESLIPESIPPGDVVGIGIHTGNALRGYAVGRLARERGAYVVFGGIHAIAVSGRGAGIRAGACGREGRWRFGVGRSPARLRARTRREKSTRAAAWRRKQFKAARWDLLPPDRYMWASVQTVRGCSKHCSFCSVWRTDGQKPRQRGSDVVIEEIVALRRLGFRFIALADDNFYPVSLTDIKNAERQGNQQKSTS